jgi:hypothetical protein
MIEKGTQKNYKFIPKMNGITYQPLLLKTDLSSTKIQESIEANVN